MTPEQYKLERAKALANEIMEMADFVAKNMRIAFPPKRLFRKKGKRPLKRLKRQRAMLALGLAPGMTRMRMLMIMSQPIPNYVPGGIVPGGTVIVGESGKEVIVTPNDIVNVPTTNRHIDPHQ